MESNNLKWARAVWVEGNREEEGVIPLCWVIGKHVMWPQGISAMRAMKEMRVPGEKWMKFNLLKIKLKSNNKQECEDHNFTTTAELSNSESEDEAKRKPKKKRFSDFVTDDNCTYHDEDPEANPLVSEDSAAERCGHQEKTSEDGAKDQSETNADLPKVPKKVSNFNVTSQNVQKKTAGKNISSRRSFSPSPQTSRSSRGSSVVSSRRSPINVSSRRSPINMSSRRSPINVSSRRSPINVSSRSPINVSSRRSPINVSSRRSSTSPVRPSRRSPINVSSRRSPINVSSRRSPINVSSRRSSPSPVILSRRSPINVSSRRSPINVSSRRSSPSPVRISRRRLINVSSSRSFSPSPEPSPRRTPCAYKSSRQSWRSRSPHSRSNRSSRSPSYGWRHGSSTRRRERSMSIDIRGNKSGFPMSEERFQRRVLFLLTEIRDVLKKNRSTNETLPDEIIPEQMQSIEELQENEAGLEDPENRTQLKRHLTKIGGVDMSDHVKKAMLRTMSNGLMAMCNMTGKNNKFAFGKTTLYRVIEESIMASHQTTEVKIKLEMASYLKYAPERIGGGGRRK